MDDGMKFGVLVIVIIMVVAAIMMSTQGAP